MKSKNSASTKRCVGRKDMSGEISEAYPGWKAESVKRGLTKIPVGCHECFADGLDSPHDMVVGELEGGDPVRIMRTARMANLVGAPLQRGYPIPDVRPQKVIRHQPALLKYFDILLDLVSLAVLILGVELPVVLLHGRSNAEGRKID